MRRPALFQRAVAGVRPVVSSAAWRARVTPFSWRVAQSDVVERTITLDESVLARLRLLSIQPRGVRPAGNIGEHRSRRRGASPEFLDFKPYAPGDDFRRIDWNSYARLDGLFVRETEATTELQVHLLLDASNSMAWTSNSAWPTKFGFASALAGALGYAALWHFDRFSLTAFNDTTLTGFGPGRGRAHVLPMIRAIGRIEPRGETVLAGTIERYLHARTRPGVLFVIADLLGDEPERLRDALGLARGRGWRVVVVQTLDPAEQSAPAAAEYLIGTDQAGELLVELVDLESGEHRLTAPTTAVLQRYGEAVETWLTETETACADASALLIRLSTGEPLEAAIDRLRERGVLA